MAGIITEVLIPVGEFALAETFVRFDAIEIEAEQVVAIGGRVMPFVWVRDKDGTDGETITDTLEADPSVATLRQLADLDDEWLYQMELVDRVEALLYVLIEEEGTVLSAEARNGYWTLRLLFADREALSRTYDHCERVGLTLDAERIYTLDEGRQGQFGLTDKQLNILELAHEFGYYDIPRATNAQTLAAEVGISHQALSERLRRAHNTLLEHTVLSKDRGERNSDSDSGSSRL